MSRKQKFLRRLFHTAALSLTLATLNGCATPQNLNVTSPNGNTVRQTSAAVEQQKVKRNIVLISMPGGMGYIGKLIADLSQTSFDSVATNVFPINDGMSSITLDQLQTQLNDAFKQGEARNGDKTTIILLGRGEWARGEVGVASNYHAKDTPTGEDIISYKALFHAIIKAKEENGVQTQTDILITTCFGASALLDETPSSLIIGNVSEYNLPADPFSITSLIASIHDNVAAAGNLSAKALLMQYMKKSNNLDALPLLYVPGKGYLDPLGEVITRIQKPAEDRITTKDIQELHRQGITAYLTPGELAESISNVQQAKTINDIGNVGHAQLVMFFLTKFTDIPPRHPRKMGYFNMGACLLKDKPSLPDGSKYLISTKTEPTCFEVPNLR